MSSQLPGKFEDPQKCFRFTTFIVKGVMRDASNTLINTTGFKGVFQMRLKATAEAAQVECSTDAGDFTFSGADGGFLIEVKPNKTKDLKRGTYDMAAIYKASGPTAATNPMFIGEVEVEDLAVQAFIT